MWRGGRRHGLIPYPPRIGQLFLALGIDQETYMPLWMHKQSLLTLLQYVWFKAKKENNLFRSCVSTLWTLTYLVLQL